MGEGPSLPQPESGEQQPGVLKHYYLHMFYLNAGIQLDKKMFRLKNQTIKSRYKKYLIDIITNKCIKSILANNRNDIIKSMNTWKMHTKPILRVHFITSHLGLVF